MLKHTVQEVALKNGAKGLLIDVPDASVMSTQINFRAGDIYVKDPAKWETAHIMEHMSLGANARYASAKKFTAELEKNGAYTNASTSHTDMTYIMECADFEWERVLDLLLLGISQPKFLESEFKSEFGNVHEEMLGRSNNHGWHLSLQMAKRFGLNMRTVQDRIELMKNVTVQDVRVHYKATHFARNMRFVIAGSLKGRKTKILSMLESMPLADLPLDRFEIPLEVPSAPSETTYIENSTVPNAYFYFDMYIPREITRDESLAMSVLGAVLVDTWGSRIFGVAREKGLIYYLQSSTDRTKGYSSWWFGSQMSEGQMPQFFELVSTELRQIAAGKLSEKEIEAAKMYMIGGHQRSAQTVDSLVNGYSGSYYYEGRVNDYYTKFPKRVQAVTTKQILDIAQELLATDIKSIGFLGTISESARIAASRQLLGVE